MTIDHTQVKLGKLAARHDTRTLKLAAYMPKLPKFPQAHSWSGAVPSWPMFKNDTIGDCTCASAGHQVGTWTANGHPPQATITDDDVLKMYADVTGWDPYDPSTDNGAYLLDVLKYWRNTGCAGHKIDVFAEIPPANSDLISAAIYLFGGAYIGLWLPKSAQGQEVWEVVSTMDDGEPGSWGGHAVIVIDYDFHGVTCVTWGGLQRMTWQFLATYCDEAYAILSQDFLTNGKAPHGFDAEALAADLAEVSGQAPVPAPTVPAYKVITLPVGSKGADTVSVLTDQKCADIVSRGGKYIVRYLPSLTTAEISRIHAHGLALQCCNYSRGSGWIPSATMGASDGTRDVTQAKGLKLPPGAIIWFDLEGCRGGSTLTKAHLETWAAIVVAAGYVAGLYVGYAPGGLDAAGLYGLRKITRYWESCSRVPQPASRGFCQRQCYRGNQSAGSVIVDWGQTHQDFLDAFAPFVVPA